MKKSKLFALAMAGIMALAMAGCGGEKAPEADKPAEAGEKLVMATNAAFPPYEFYENDKIVGIDAEIAEKIAEKLGKTLEIVDTEFGSIIAGVQTGKYDMGMAGLTVTDERKQSVNFTSTYATGIQSIIVTEGSEIATPDDLEGKKIGVQQDTTGHIYTADQYGDEMVTPFNKGTDAVAALVSGKVDCVVIDNEPAKSFVEANSGLKILDTEYATEDYAICVAKEDEQLLKDINTALEELIADGTVQSIVDKYISAE